VLKVELVETPVVFHRELVMDGRESIPTCQYVYVTDLIFMEGKLFE